MANQPQPTVFHLTHWKAGSQWVMAVLSETVGNRVVKPKVNVSHFYDDPIIPGGVYPTVYAARPRFENTLFPDVSMDAQAYRPSPTDEPNVQNWYNFTVQAMPVIKFVIIRDLRDTMISLYFSLKVSHPIITDGVAKGRQTLNEMGFEDGFINLLNERGKRSANIQRSWMPACRKGEALLVRYEDLIADEQGGFAKIAEHCQFEIAPTKLAQIVEKNSFSKKAGRKPGEEDISSHYRKGISGDWKNHFTDRIKTEFKEMFGEILIQTGYEKDLNW